MSDNTKLNRDGLNQVWLKAMTILKSLTGNVRTDKGTLQEQIDKLEENASSGVDLTQAEYDALPDSKETDGVDYYITDEDFVATDAKAVGYDNTASRLAAENVQDAVDELSEDTENNANDAALASQTLGYSKKNLIPYTYHETTHNDSGITWTDNGDGSVTANGTANDLSQFYFISDKTMNLKPNTSYKISGCPSGGSRETYDIRAIINYNHATAGAVNIYDVGNGKTFTTPSDYDYIRIMVDIRKGTTVSNLTFYPMLRDAAIVDDTWEPYVPSVDERINALWTAINELNSQG